MYQGRVKLHTLTGRLLVVTIWECCKAIGPAVSCIWAKATQVWEHSVVTVVACCIAHQKVHHVAPLCGPSRTILLHKSGRMNEITPMEMVVVQTIVLTMACRIAQQSAPSAMVKE